MPKRVRAYVDGFNLYHAIDNHVREHPDDNHLKWVDLWRLCEEFSRPPQYTLEAVYYFSAFATWKTGAYRRHQAYEKALKATGVRTKMGTFARHPMECLRCGRTWIKPEEKESDVALGTHIVRDALRDRFDRALVICADRDVAPALRMLATETPGKQAFVLLPPGTRELYELTKIAGGRGHCRRIKIGHIRRSLLPDHVIDGDGNFVVSIPEEYRKE